MNEEADGMTWTDEQIREALQLLRNISTGTVGDTDPSTPGWENTVGLTRESRDLLIEVRDLLKSFNKVTVERTP